MTISFCNEDAKYASGFKRMPFKALVKHIISTESKKSVDYINFIVCSDSFLLGINKEYLNHDYFTDIITFDYSQDTISSDIYISVDRVSDNAKQNSVSTLIELYRVLIHGVLHLVGYQDNNDANKKKMTQKENYYLHLIS